MTLVLDASVGIEVALDRSRADLFSKEILASERVITSDFYKIEVANIIWKYVKANLLEKSKANKTLQLAQSLVDEFIDISENNEEAMNESFRLTHSTYDLLYFTLARRYSAKLLTLDKRLRQLAEDGGIDVLG